MSRPTAVGCRLQMGILDEDVARVRESTDLVALASEHLALKRVGQRCVRPLPVPLGEVPVVLRSTPSLGVYHCFGCQQSGDAITFVREVEHLDFVDAVERLAARAGHHAALRRRVAHEGSAAQAPIGGSGRRGDRLLPPAAARRPTTRGNARRYLRSRGFDGDAVAPVRARLVTRRVRRAERASPAGRSSRATTSSAPASRS